MPDYKKPVFVVGMPRSGTTLIQGILCNTGKYFPVPETHFFARAAYGLPEDHLNQKQRKRIEHKLLKKSRISLDQGLPAYLTTQKDIFEHVIDQYNLAGLPSFLEKTPRHIFFYSKILKYYPDARFICMIREPKNVISSQLTNSPKENKSVIRLSLLYNKITAAISKIGANKNVYTLKYEDLTSETEKVLFDTCNFLDIPFASSLVDNVAAPPGIVSSHEFWKQKNIDQATIQQNNAAKWRRVLTPGQASITNFMTKSHAAKFGYDLPYDWSQVLSGLKQDIGRLFSAGEFKKAFSKYHG